MGKPKAPAFDPKDLPESSSTGYPKPYKSRVAGRHKRRLGDHVGLKNFGVNLTRLDPGAESSMRHWHMKQDEFVYIVEGEITLVTDAGRQKLGPGMAAGFPAGKADGHQLVNETDKPVLYLEIGDRTPGDEGSYPADDLKAVLGPDGRWSFSHKDGRPY